jgi:hypothetical protein
MQNNQTTFEEKIASAKPAELSATEEAIVFSKAFARHTSGKTESVFASLFITQSKTMIPLALIFALLLGAGGTVAASDGARPGDILFPVDRAIEDLKLTFASDDGKNELRIKYANERVKEFDDIADDETGDDEVSGSLTEVEADIFTNETVVKLEAGDRKVTFITDANTREEIIDVIHDRYGFSTEEIDALLNLETEDRASRPEDRGESARATARLEDAVDVLGDFIEKNRDAASTSPDVLAALALIEARLFDRSAFFPEEVRVKVRDDRARYEVRGEDGERVRVEIKDGEIRIKSRDNDDDDDRDEDEDDDRDEDDDSNDDDDDRAGVPTNLGFLEIEADVFADKTVVTVELNDRKTTFTMASSTTRADVIDEVEDRFEGLTRSQIDSALDFEVEDRASRPEDEDEDEDDDSDDDDDRDEDEDDQLEIEAEVHSNSTSVEVELNDVKTRFSTTATTRAGIIDAIEARFSELSESEIDSALELEFDEEDEEDDDNSSSGGDDDSDEDEDDEDEDEDEEDDDRRGRGGDDDDDDKEDDN